MADYKAFWKFIDFLDQYHFLEHIILIGSWAEYLYQETELLTNYTPNIRTFDIDFLIKNKGLPREKQNLLQAAEKEGYIIEQDYITNTSKIYMTEERFEIEFLIAQKGSGTIPVMETNLGVNAQALRHLSVLLNNSTTVKFIEYRITVPLPEAYVLHKIIINQQRKEKAEKDLQSITRLLPHINKDICKKIFMTLTKKEQKIIQKFFDENHYRLDD